VSPRPAGRLAKRWTDQTRSLIDGWQWGDRRIIGFALVLIAVLFALTVYRIVAFYQTPGPFTPERQGLCDFHNGIYFPTRAVLAGESPYSQAYAAKYPVARQIPFFSPVILVLHAPLVLLPLGLAETIHHLVQWVMVIGIAVLAAAAASVRRFDFVLVVVAAILVSRGGHVTLFTGYFTFQLVLATLLALKWADNRPWWSAVALMIVASKPTYILPLGFLMSARGHWKALIRGAGFSLLGTGATLAPLVYQEGGGDLSRGVRVLVSQIAETQAVHRSMEDESPVYSWTRLDLFAIVAKWRGLDPGDLQHLIGMGVVLAVPMMVLWKRRRQAGSPASDAAEQIGGIDGALILTASLVSLYHQSYDALLMVVPVAAILMGRNWPWSHSPLGHRGWLAALLAWPLLNYFSTRMFLLRLDPSPQWVKVLTSLNGLALTVGLIWLCLWAWRYRGNSLVGSADSG